MAYVYKHIRIDNNITFYIGIGSDKNFKRAFSKCDRNKYWKNLVNKYGYYVEIIKKDISWEEACIFEKECIKLYGRLDLKSGTLVNMTDGGEGIIGLIHSDEHRRKNSEANKGKKKSEEQILKFKKRRLSNVHKQKLIISRIGKHHTDETKKKISEKLKNKFSGINNPFYGKKHSDDIKKIISNKGIGRVVSENTKKKMSQSHIGKTHTVSDKTKLKMSILNKERNIIPPSRKGSCWIIKDNISKTINKIELDYYISIGWTKGRKIKIN